MIIREISVISGQLNLTNINNNKKKKTHWVAGLTPTLV